MHARCQTSFETELDPAGVIAALVDFSAARPELWPALDPAKFVVHELGPTHALVTEGSKRPAVWARERYDWSQRRRVSWRTEASNFCTPGSGVDVSAEALGEGGSRVTVSWQRTSSSPVGWLVVASVRLMGRRLLTSMYRPVFDRLARQGYRPPR